MSNELIPFDVSGIRATYYAPAQTLLVTAEGTVPNKVLGPSFERVTIPGGMKLRVVSAMGGIPGPDKKVSFQFPVTELPTPRFQNVTIVTAATWSSSKQTETSIPWTTSNTPMPSLAPPPIVALKPQPLPTSMPKPDPKASQLQPIPLTLPANNFVRVTTPVPDPAIWRYTIEARGDPEMVCVWRAGAMPGSFFWDLAWGGDNMTLPAGQKGTFTVTTSQSAVGQTDGPVQITVQPYAVKMS
jgi:hypothetical protein